MRTLRRSVPGVPVRLLSLPLFLLCVAVPAGAQPETAVDPFERLYFPGAVVGSATRSPKPVSQAAENVTIVTAAEIEAMQAHTLAEVLNRVTGVFVEFFGVRFGANALAHVQGSGETQSFTRGSAERHVTVLLDGVPWNTLGGTAILDTIPVGAIDRIEVIQGPASSVWGSALAGVINVITGAPGGAVRPSGVVQGSYGQRDAYDGRAEVAGAAGPLGYYVQGQVQHTDWEGGGGFEGRSILAGAEASLGGQALLTLGGGYSRPEIDAGTLESFFARVQDEYREGFGRVGVDLSLDPHLTLHAVGYLRKNRLAGRSQEDGTFAPAGDLFRDVVDDEEHAGAQGWAVWTPASHTLVLGVDYRRSEFDQAVDSGDFLQAEQGAPPHAEFSSDIESLGVYLNDTAALGPVTVTPGLRYDHTSRTGSFWSPSLGATWQVNRDLLLRASVARGFTIPPLENFGAGFNRDPNPDLDPERVWSYQAGVETTAVPALWLKVTAFRHEVQGSLEAVPSPVTEGNITVVNQGWVWRTGFQAEAETARWQGLALRAGFAYVHVEKAGEERTQDQYQTNLALSYEAGPWKAGLFGHYVWWDLGPGAEEGRHNDGLWDLTASRSFEWVRLPRAEVFAAVRNLFNGDQEIDTNRGTEPRWAEAGLRVWF